MGQFSLDVRVGHNRSISYAYTGTNRPIVRSISVLNTGSEESTGTKIRPRVFIESPFDQKVIEEWVGLELELPRPSNNDVDRLEWLRVVTRTNPALLGRLSERANATLVVQILVGDEVVSESRSDLVLLAANEWMNDQSCFDSLAAFVLANSKAIAPILVTARQLLKDRTGSSATEGYQAQESNPMRVMEIAEAVYDSIRQLELDYSNPPAAFENFAQKIRTPRQIVDSKSGTCLDTTVLYAACLAQCGLDPFLVLVKGHAFSGFFSIEGVDSRLGKSVVEDPSQLQMLFENGLIVPVETTTMCGGASSETFASALSRVKKYWAEDSREVQGLVVVSNAWRSGLTPPPANDATIADEIDTQYVFGIKDDKHDQDNVVSDLSSDGSIAVVDGAQDRNVPPRVRQWMNSLLDLSTRNQLLSLKVKSSRGKSGETARFMEFDLPGDILGAIDDRLFKPGARIPIHSPARLPSDWKHAGVLADQFGTYLRGADSPFIYPSYTKINELPTRVQRTIEARDKDETGSTNQLQKLTNLDIERLVYANFEEESDALLKNKMAGIKSLADEVLLENGTNSLYIALGILDWTEDTLNRGQRNITHWSAPLYLYPVILEGGKGSPFTVRLDSTGSITPNYCLREKLRRPPYNIDLAELEYPEMDAAGIDFDKMIRSIDAKLKLHKLTGFSIQRRCVMGVFDYSTFRLWKDLYDHWSQMRDDSPVVRHVMYTPGEKFVDSAEMPEPRLDPYLPIEADDSQINAIQWALDGRSFRLEGPPGTGKTQTITNLIASCLAHDKKILFVAEKQTALQQVKKRLHSIGLGDFCLELHAKGDSDTRLRKNIAAQLGGAIEAEIDPQDAKWNDNFYAVGREQEVLDKYRDALHSLNDAELSLWLSREGLAELGEGASIKVPRDFLTQYATYWKIFREVSFDLPLVCEVAGSLQNNRWSFVENNEFDKVDRAKLASVLQGMKSSLDGLISLPFPWSSLLDITDPLDLGRAATVGEFAASGMMPSSNSFAQGVGGPAWAQLGGDIVGKAEELSALLSVYRSVFQPGIIRRADLEQIRLLIGVVEKSNMFNGGKNRKALLSLLGNDVLVKDFKVMLPKLKALLDVVIQSDVIISRIGAELKLPVSPTWSLLSPSGVEELKSHVSRIREISQFRKSSGIEEFVDGLTSATSVDALSLATLRQASLSWLELGKLLKWDNASLKRWLDDKSVVVRWNEDLTKWIADCGENDRFLELQRWIDVVACVDRLRQCRLDSVRDDILNGSVSPEKINSLVQRGVLLTSLEERLEAGNIDKFDGQQHDRRIANFEVALSELRQLMKQRIPGLISKRKRNIRLPNGKLIGETQDLLRELKPVRGEKTPIRTLIQKYGESLANVMPCFLMSPDSVATLVPMGSIAFDLVIFDEASQVRTSHAVGALGRGVASIVVGDSKQMPPSTAFASNKGRYVEDDDESDGSEIEEQIEGEEEMDSDGSKVDLVSLTVPAAAKDVESILQEFEASKISYLQLLCHYRSKDELLIAFSNAEIYEKPMMTFPSVSGMSSTALQMIRLDGQFNRKKNVSERNFRGTGETVKLTRTNIVEADAVVAEVMSRLRDPGRIKRRESGKSSGAESIIVVTFNKPQQELIVQLLKMADSSGNPVVEKALEPEKDEETGVVVAEPQLKVRNLESVQGDEAESVIFSVAFSKFAPDEKKAASNRVPLNFGPVTQDGGYRRLNVAVTRAQRELLVYCSFDPADMAVKETSSEDVRLLQRFLMLAKNGPKKNGDIGVAVAHSKHIDEVASAIKAKGYRVQTQMGLSSLRVDIAVGRMESEKWDIAVMLDGPTWAARGSAYQREVLPKTVLTALGWKRIVRVWVPSWIHEKESVIQRICEAMEGKTDEKIVAKQKIDIEPNPIAAPKPTNQDGSVPANKTKIVKFDNKPFNGFVPTEPADRDLLDNMQGSLVQEIVIKMIQKVLEVEAPIETTRLARIIGNWCGLERVRQARMEELIGLIPRDQIEETGVGDFVWLTSDQKNAWGVFRPENPNSERDLDEIHPNEFVNALLDTLQHARSLAREEATRLVAGIFGYSKLTAKVRTRIEQVLNRAVSEGSIILDAEDRYRLPS